MRAGATFLAGVLLAAAVLPGVGVDGAAGVSAVGDPTVVAPTAQHAAGPLQDPAGDEVPAQAAVPAGVVGAGQAGWS